MGKTSIEWTDASWNPIVGCTEISPGCANCYAARLAATRLRNTSQYHGLAEKPTGEFYDRLNKPARWTGEVRFLPDRLEEPVHWRKPRRIFVCDMGDLFHEAVKEEWLCKVFDVIQRCPQHTFQILTKRPARMQAFLRVQAFLGISRFYHPHVWLGVSVETQRCANERIPLLLTTPAAVRWISAEPLLGTVDIEKYLRRGLQTPVPASSGDGVEARGPRIDWVVCGGESGPNARPMYPDWARSLRDQCSAAGVPFFFKQWGEFAPLELSSEQTHIRVGKKRAGRRLDGREWNEFPRGASAKPPALDTSAANAAAAVERSGKS